MGQQPDDQVRNIAGASYCRGEGRLDHPRLPWTHAAEILELKNTIKHHGGPAQLVRRRSDARGARSGYRRKAGRPGGSEGRGRRLERFDDSVNGMAGNLTNQVRNIAEVTTAVAKGDLSTRITVDARGEILQLKNTINTMVDQLSSFAAEVTRVAREVGTEGKLGGQADVPGVGGTWKDLTDSVNFMAGKLDVVERDVVTSAICGPATSSCRP